MTTTSVTSAPRLTAPKHGSPDAEWRAYFVAKGYPEATGPKPNAVYGECLGYWVPPRTKAAYTGPRSKPRSKPRARRVSPETVMPSKWDVRAWYAAGLFDRVTSLMQQVEQEAADQQRRQKIQEGLDAINLAESAGLIDAATAQAARDKAKGN